MSPLGRECKARGGKEVAGSENRMISSRLESWRRGSRSKAQMSREREHGTGQWLQDPVCSSRCVVKGSNRCSLALECLVGHRTNSKGWTVFRAAPPRDSLAASKACLPGQSPHPFLPGFLPQHHASSCACCSLFSTQHRE